MTATGQDVTIRQGETRVLKFTVTETDGSAIPQADISTATWRLAKNANLTSLISRDSDGAQVRLTQPDATLVVEVDIVTADTDTRNRGEYFHQLWVKDTNDREYVVSEGDFVVKERIEA